MNYNTYIIAEIGINHEGSFSLCKEMVYAAKEAGVKAVKLQTIDPEKNYAKNTKSYKIFSDAKLTSKETEEIFLLCNKLKLDIFTTVGDIETANWIKKLKPAAWKISSGLFTHIPLIRHLAAYRERVFLSTGLANDKEVNDVIKIFKNTKKKNYSLLHCVSKYPTKSNEANLSRMQYLKKKYKVEIGYSDHTLGNLACCIAVANGASIIEKHFTNNSKRKGYDHKISLDYKGMQSLVNNIKETELLIKNDKNFISKVESNRKKFLRILVANRMIKKGDKFNEENISIKRVNNNQIGISPIALEKLKGKKSKNNYSEDNIINKKELKD